MHHTRDPREGWAMTDMAMDVADGGRGPDHPRPKVLIVGWDGVRDDTARRLSPSTLSGLAEHGRWWSTTLPGIDVALTVTAVGWATILTGVWPDAHGVMGNEEELNRLHRYPELLTTAFCARPDLHTYGAASASAECRGERSEEHTSELQSRGHLVCRLLPENK